MIYHFENFVFLVGREGGGLDCHNSKLTHDFRQSMDTESVSTTVNLLYPIPVRTSDFVLTKGS